MQVQKKNENGSFIDMKTPCLTLRGSKTGVPLYSKCIKILLVAKIIKGGHFQFPCFTNMF